MNALRRLGGAFRDSGQTADARAAWRSGIHVLGELGVDGSGDTSRSDLLELLELLAGLDS